MRVDIGEGEKFTMTYDDLKSLEMPTLLALLEKQIRLCYDLTPDQFVQDGRLPPPVLFEIGDFEIRARFCGPPCPTKPPTQTP
jgi:hypothetical protein